MIANNVIIYQSIFMSTGQNISNNQIVDVVALALRCREDNKIMLARRGPNGSGAGHWEFPGGKIEPNETQQDALRREIIEELDFDIKGLALNFLGHSLYQYDIRVVNIHLWIAEIEYKPEFKLIDHDLLDWFEVQEIEKINLSPADKPFISMIY